MAAPNLNAFVAAFLKQVQVVENAFQAVIVSRFVGFAVGVQLDALGRLVGEGRLGRTDDDYRKGIRIRVYINGSNGRPEDFIYVARQLTGFQQVQYLDVPQVSGAGGNFRIVIPGWPGDDGTVFKVLNSIRAAGTRLLDVTPSATLLPRRMGDRMGVRLYHT